MKHPPVTDTGVLSGCYTPGYTENGKTVSEETHCPDNLQACAGEYDRRDIELSPLETANGTKVRNDKGKTFEMTVTDIRGADPTPSDKESKLRLEVAVHCDNCIDGTDVEAVKASLEEESHSCIGTQKTFPNITHQSAVPKKERFESSVKVVYSPTTFEHSNPKSIGKTAYDHIDLLMIGSPDVVVKDRDCDSTVKSGPLQETPGMSLTFGMIAGESLDETVVKAGPKSIATPVVMYDMVSVHSVAFVCDDKVAHTLSGIRLPSGAENLELTILVVSHKVNPINEGGP